MAMYSVIWKIDIEAENPDEAAAKALEIQRRPDSTATVFEVCQRGCLPVTIDLDDHE